MSFLFKRDKYVVNEAPAQKPDPKEPTKALPEKPTKPKDPPKSIDVKVTVPTEAKEKEIVEDVAEETVDIGKRRSGYRGVVEQLDGKEIVNHPKKQEEKLMIKSAIETNEFLRNLFKGALLDEIIETMYPRDVTPNEIIIKQGDNGDHLFVSGSGRYEISIDEKVYDTFNDNRIFGELAILYNNPRLATIKALSAGRVWILNRSIYQQIRIKNAKAEGEEMLSFLQKVPTVNTASKKKLQKILGLLEDEFYKTGTEIIKQGDTGDKFYIIKSGTASVIVEGEGCVATLVRGQYFGERALLQNDVRKATVVAEAPGVECLSLSRTNFNKYLGDLESFLKTEEKKVEHKPVVKKYADVELSQLKRIKTIGMGAFGRVELVTYKHDINVVFALKYLKKENVMRKNMRQLTATERKIHMSLDSEFIVQLYKTFQDKKYLYFLMESCLGGDLWYLRTSQKGAYFSEDSAKFLSGCILEALSYLHEHDIMYLDLKPENVVIDVLGYAKLIDFGNAVRVDDEQDFGFMGTPEYVAPEIILQKGYEKSADYWAFGILIFELLVGKTPFASKSQNYSETYNLIINGIDAVRFPPRLSKYAESIIKKLCRSNRAQRLGALKNGIDDIREHKWYSGFNWEKLRKRKTKSPFNIKLSGPVDTKYFKETFKEDTAVLAEYDIWEEFN